MGMAASQARYLALTARKTNTEYEGQQINQARTALANQSANLFNRLLNMEVPNPPKTSDYTKVQYSYSDGENASVIDEWQQLSGVNPDYNYLVKSHYFASSYTGAMRQLTDPQVQIGGNGNNIDKWEIISQAKSSLDLADYIQQMRYSDLQRTITKENADIKEIQGHASDNNSRYNLINSTINQYKIDETPDGYTLYQLKNSADDTGTTYNIKYFDDPDAVTGEHDPEDIQSILQGVKDMLDTNLLDVDTLNQYLYENDSRNIIDESNISQIMEQIPRDLGAEYNEIQKEILKVFGLQTSDEDDFSRIVLKSDIDTIINDPRVSVGEDDWSTIAHSYELKGTFLKDSSEEDPAPSLKSYADKIRDRHLINIETAQNEYNAAYAKYEAALRYYNNNVTKPTYIGNSELTPLLDPSDEQKVELLQVVKDMKAQNIDTDILNRFDADGNYLGEIYSFQMNGVTYYTTQKSLEDAYESYPRNKSNNSIDAQYKMPYYNASYIDTRIENENYAILETDGSGRFKTVKFKDNSIVYSLNTETVTDEAAYEDAMNHYLYEKDKYEKTIADINAKTSIIQKEDRTLELRLKQLDTEQNALKTEMDAVKKVIKDNVESTFKTFSD